MLDTIVQSDCVEFCEFLNEGSVDLIFTSPPYAGTPRKYLASNPIYANDYVSWFLPKISAFKRVLKDTGSFVLNIADCIVDGEIHPFLDDLKREIRKEFLYVEDFLWVRTNSVPNAPIHLRPLRVYEHCFWFAKSKNYQWFPDQVRTAYNPATLARYNRGDSGNSPNAKYYGIDKRENVKYAKGQMGQDWNRVKPHPNGASPSNVIAGSRYSGRSLGHPAVFPEYLPRFFIDAMTKTGDLVFDPFSGSGMTAVASLKLDRHFLGCDLSETYVNLALKRLSEVQKEMKT